MFNKLTISLLLILSCLSSFAQDEEGKIIDLLLPGDTIVFTAKDNRVAAYKNAPKDLTLFMPSRDVFTYEDVLYKIEVIPIYGRMHNGSFIGPNFSVTGRSMDGTRTCFAVVSAMLRRKDGTILSGTCRYTYAVDGPADVNCTFIKNRDECFPALDKTIRDQCRLSYGKDYSSFAGALEGFLLKVYPEIPER